jgi:tetratricopeptide (TPR) repeat protein
MAQKKKKSKTKVAAKPAKRRAIKVIKKPSTKRAGARRPGAGKGGRPAKALPGSRKIARTPGSRGKHRAKSRTSDVLFLEGVEHTARGFLFDAITAFREAIRLDPRGDLADDALYNIGACFLRMRLLKDAEEAFSRIIQQYPNATISATVGGNEHGRTAAKALLGRIHARLGQGDERGARDDLESLRGYDDSYATDPSGRRRTFHELGTAMVR